MSKRKHIKQAEYKRIKILIKAGVRGKDLTHLTDRSASTTGYVAKSKNYEDYRRIVASKGSPKVEDVNKFVSQRNGKSENQRIFEVLKEMKGLLKDLKNAVEMRNELPPRLY